MKILFLLLIPVGLFAQEKPTVIVLDRLGFFYPELGERVFVNPGDSVTLISFDKISTWKIIYKGAKGSISEAYLIDNKEYRKKFIPVIKPETEKEKHARMIKEYGNVLANDILYKTIRLGQSEWVLKEILGKPDDINRMVGSFGTHEQWVYNKGSKMKLYYFENGKLTGWQD